MMRCACGLLALLILLSACSPSMTPKTDGFCCRLVVEYGGAEYRGIFERPDASSATLRLSDPVALSGLTMSWDGSKVTVQYLGMEMSVGEEELPVGAVIRVLCEALDAVGDGAPSSDTARIEGDSSCGMFTLTLDKSGYPSRLEIPAVAFLASFYDWETPDGI